MSGRDTDSTSVSPTKYPDEYENGRLVGVSGRGDPVYFEPADQRAFEVMRDGDELQSRDPEWSGSLSDIVDEIENAVGWDSLTDFGSDSRSDD